MKLYYRGIKTLKQLYDVVLGEYEQKFDYFILKIKEQRIEFRLFCYMVFANIVINRF